jgi:hypothetical protein
MPSRSRHDPSAPHVGPPAAALLGVAAGRQPGWRAGLLTDGKVFSLHRGRAAHVPASDLSAVRHAAGRARDLRVCVGVTA